MPGREAGGLDISVVLPVHRGERFLDECLRSVLAQVGVSFEVLVGVDGPDPASEAVLRNIGDSRVLLDVQPANRGLFPTMNSLVRRANAPIIKLWAQDDVMNEGCLRTVAAHFERYSDIGSAYSACNFIDEEGKFQGTSAGQHLPPRLGINAAKVLTYQWGCLPGNIATMAIRREVGNRLHWFDESFRLAGDFDLHVRLVGSAPIGFVDQPLVDIRRHRGQLSRQVASEAIFVEENSRIIRALECTFPEELHEWMRRYRIRVRGAYMWQALVRSILRGQFSLARVYLRAISSDKLWAGAAWFLTPASERAALGFPLRDLSF